MRLNWNTALVGSKVVLKPYRKEFVKRYHAWMEDEWLREMTASERLSLEEEYTNQQLWIDDEQKLTFLVFDAEEATVSNEADEAAQLKGLAGDVNIFMLEPDHSEDYCTASGAEEESKTTGKPAVTAEIMVMMADPAYRRKGLAVEAVSAMMRFGMESSLGITTFVAKISEDNEASINLFTNKLGFVEAKRIKAFGEVHLVCGPKQGLKERVLALTTAKTTTTMGAEAGEEGAYRQVEYRWGNGEK